MQRATGELVQIYLENELTGGRILCPQKLIPSAGQYLLAHNPALRAPLAVPIFNASPAPGGFLLAPPIPPAWQPGISLNLRGPLGRGFSMPGSARCVALVALAETAARLKPILSEALGQGASIVLVSDLDLPDLPPEVEFRPTAALAEVAGWADYLAVDVVRESLPGLREKLGHSNQTKANREAQVLVRTPMPCGGIADCGVCAVTVRRGWRLACKDGPVFSLAELI
jgi:hypothetical protein